MKNLWTKLFGAMLVLAFFAFPYQTVEAQTRAYRVSDQNVKRLLTRIETRTDTYKRDMNKALDRSRFNNTSREDLIFDYITDFENATDQLKQRFDAKRSVDSDVTNVLNRAAMIDQFMKSTNLAARSKQTWGYLKTDLQTLSRYYNVTFDWNAAVQNGSTVTAQPYRVSDTMVKGLLTRIEAQTDVYKRQMNNALDRSTLNNTEREDEVFNYITEFENSTDQLKQRFDAKTSVAADVENVLLRASSINTFMTRNRLTTRSESSWNDIRANLMTLSNYYNVAWDWNKVPVNTTTTAYTVAGRSVQDLLARLESKTDVYKREMNTALDRSVLNNSQSEDSFNAYIDEFENATDRLKQRFDSNQSTDTDAENVLNRAAYIDAFMRDYRFTRSSETQWRSIRSDLDTLSNYYAVSWNWNRPNQASEFDSRLTGTYRLNTALSDNVDRVVEASIKLYPQTRENRVERRLKNRLMSPEMLAIEKRNTDVTVASSNAQQISFKADGIARTESAAGGQNVTVTANTTYDGVSVNYVSDRNNDFYVNFIPMDNGRLKVLRRVYLPNNEDMVTVASIYDRTNSSANFTIVGSNNNASSNGRYDRNDFIVPNGTQLTAELNSLISTKASQDGDRFTMKVTSPSRFDGAIIEGRVLNPERSGRISGRANLSLDFDTIRLRNGRTYRFAGLVENVTLASGEKVTVNNEGAVRDNNQTSKTAKRAGIGAGVGAILGAILGGGDGAAIGAAIGAGAGAGTVIAQGRDDVEMGEGSQISITASAPVNASIN
ncbi:MAG: hypothetical protein R2681_15820 [Pyrinomonadaceae bacterium]